MQRHQQSHREHSKRSLPIVRVAVVTAVFVTAALACEPRRDDAPATTAGIGEPEQRTPAVTTPPETRDPATPTDTRTPARTETPPTDQPPVGRPGTMTDQQVGAACPTMMDGVDVKVSDTDDGVALTFTSDTADAREIQSRVQQLAWMYENYDGRAGMMWQHMRHTRAGVDQDQPPTAAQQPGQPMPQVDVRVIPIEQGARLELTPKAPGQADSLREQLREHQRHFAAGECLLPGHGEGHHHGQPGAEDQPGAGQRGAEPGRREGGVSR
jgi:hypothetical protein